MGLALTACGGAEPVNPAETVEITESSEPAQSTAYRWPGGDACEIVDHAPLYELADGTPSNVSAHLETSHEGGQCQTEIVGDGGMVFVDTKVMVHRLGESAAKETYDALAEPLAPGAVEETLHGLGSRAHWSQDPAKWRGEERMSCTLTVQDGNTVVSVIFVGSPDVAVWPQYASGLQDELRSVAEGTLENLPAE